MKAINRRLTKLEQRFAPPVVVVDGWSAKEELLKRLASLRARMRPENVELDESAREAVRQRFQAWMRDWRKDPVSFP